VATKKKTRAKTTTRKKPVRRKAVTKKKTTVTQKPNPTLTHLAYTLFAAAATYGFASWAIDRGSLWLYLAAFIGVYMTASHATTFLRLLFSQK